MLQIGMKGSQATIVSETNTARALKSGELDVFATPAMIALVEETAWKSVSDQLGPGEGTVGTKVEISHLSATPVGMAVRCETELVEIDGRRLVFRADVYDEAVKIGTGMHERFVVQNEKFLNRAQSKL